MFIFQATKIKMEEENTSFHGLLKKQASFFFKSKFKMARLAFTDVTPAQLLTEEATSGNPWPPDAPTMRVITRAAFEVNDFFRIVEILHNRLKKFKAKDWRAGYNALILLEHVLTHGPQSFAEEFEDDLQIFKTMDGFHFLDEKGVRKLSARVVKLLEDREFLKEERSRVRNLSRGIQGFGNFSHRSFPTTADSHSGKYKRYNSECIDRRSDRAAPARENSPIKEKEAERRLKEEGDSESKLGGGGENTKVDHPFCEFKHQVSESLLSSSIEW
ncbi:epsin-3-like isoform X2 [Momordica charantia]|uniref:Epsin-3-like isoform X2 n=1 Tax=Momordica charantia TaxID=3673 RepID=A0A6J1CBF1_MOMCH|nr:epsin-3-like isoform X2 [Momordica charantia]